MGYKKLTADCKEDLMEKIKRALDIEKRTLANFIRLACEERADKILEEENGKKPLCND